MTLLAEDLLVVLLDDHTGKPIADSTKLPRVLAGALVLDLATSGSVRITERGEQVKDGRLVTTGSTPPSDPLLGRAFGLIASAKAPMKPQKVIEKLQKKLTGEVGSRLVQQGMVTARHDKILGLFPTTTWPAVDTAHKAELVRWIRSAIVDGTTPTPGSSALISLLSAVDVIHKVLPDVDKKAAKKRAKDIAEGEWASEAVRKAVQDVNTAVMAAVMVPVIVSTTSS